ncbi:MAG: hypothetical protein LBR55_04360 [Bacteroidales bacterium]|jgi:hypothetical protein|nr:hypothetical protein [Bacteroidales bacterium]
MNSKSTIQSKKKDRNFSLKGIFFRFIRGSIKFITSPFILLWYRLKHNNSEEFKQREKASFFDTKLLSQPLPYIPRHICHGLNYYGFFSSFTQYAGIKKINSRYGIEHGLYIAAKGKKYGTEITFSDYREQALLKAHAKAIKIGPYIHYATPVLDDSSFLKLKQQLGKVLLVFPVHSIDSVKIMYDIQAFIDFIEDHKAPYNTVMVCLHWKDFELHRDIMYEKQGYKIVTAGHPYDTHFLSRLKSIISLSDMVVANDVGTFLGYSIYMNKPVYLYSQPIEFTIGNSEKSFNKEINIRNHKEWEEVRKVKKNLHELFNIFEEKITSEQYSKVSYLFGFDYIRDNKTLKKLLQ